ncbi:MAG: hypothetical protein F6K39_05885 [Okeania sp. SIO3B3]|nr:hypothetical protein [Okeania sp. SIO3B3]
MGLFSYGSGCSSEFYSGVITPEAKDIQAQQRISGQLAERCSLSFEEYQYVLHQSNAVAFGTRNVTVDQKVLPKAWQQVEGKGRLVLKEIKEFHREYEWV